MGGSHRIDRTGGKQPTGPLGKQQKAKSAPLEPHHAPHPRPAHPAHADGHHLQHGDAVRSRDPQRQMEAALPPGRTRATRQDLLQALRPASPTHRVHQALKQRRASRHGRAQRHHAVQAHQGGRHAGGPGSAAFRGDIGGLQAKLDHVGISRAYLQGLSQRYGVPMPMILGVIMQESGGNPNAHSPAGARGLMQLMPGTARGLGVHNSLDPRQNVEGGVKYLGQLMHEFHGVPANVLAAYNAGPGRVRRYHGVPPIRETRQYVANIQGYMARLHG